MSEEQPPILDYARPMNKPPRRWVRAFLKRVWRIYAFRIWIAAVIAVLPLAAFFAAFGFGYGHAGILAFLALVAWGGPFLRSRPWQVFVIAAVFGCIVTFGLYSAARKIIVVQNDSEHTINELRIHITDNQTFSLYQLPARRMVQVMFRDLGYDGKMSAEVYFTSDDGRLRAIRRSSATGYRGRTRIVIESETVATITDD